MVGMAGFMFSLVNIEHHSGSSCHVRKDGSAQLVLGHTQEWAQNNNVTLAKYTRMLLE